MTFNFPVMCVYISTLLFHVCGTAHAEDQIRLALPKIAGNAAISGAVSSILRFRFWGNLYQSGSNSRGAVAWGRNQLESTGFKSAEALAQQSNVLAQLVLFGEAYPFDLGAVVHTYLALPQYDDGRKLRNEVWKVDILKQAQSISFSADVPRRRYSFPPIVIPQPVVDMYKSDDGIIIYRDRALSVPIGTLGIDNNLLEIAEEAARVRSEGKVGWVSLRELKFPNSMLQFTSGLFRLYRGDWVDAERFMSSVANDDWSPTDLKVDANLLRAFALEQRNISGRSAVLSAKKLSPYAKRVVIYEAMAELSELSRQIKRGASDDQRSAIAEKIHRTIESQAFLFSLNDPWLNNFRENLARIR